MPLVSRLGAASSRGFGEFNQQGPFNYIEDVFSTWLYTGNNTTNTITNGVDLAGKGGLVWTKPRDVAAEHMLWDTTRGIGNYLVSNTTAANVNLPGLGFSGYGLTAFNSNGFTLGDNWNGENTNASSLASWTFRKAPKFFTICTWTGDGVTGRQISHDLGVVPGMVIVKCTSSTPDWVVSHRSLTAPDYELSLNQTRGQQQNGIFGAAGNTSTYIQLGLYNQSYVNSNGATYVAYLFAHDAGGFGADGSQNVISCGSYTGNGSTTGPVINLGYEPQYVLIKKSSAAGGWVIFDTMRGLPVGNYGSYLLCESSAAEVTNYVGLNVSATGFQPNETDDYINGSGGTYIYMAIRRGPMRTPTDATKVYAPVAYTATNVDGRLISSGFPVDSAIIDPRNGYSTPGGPNWFSRLTGNGYFLQTAQTAAELNGNSNSNGIMGQDGITVSRNGTNVWSNVGSNTYISWFLARAPGFFDVSCYTGTGSAQTISHNLGVAPELIITKVRSAAGYYWAVYAAPYGATRFWLLNDTYAGGTDSTYWNNTNPTSTVFSVGTNSRTNLSGGTLVAYLFASCPGVSKVGSYTGTGATQTISCGFTGGARYVLIKRTDSTGDWYVWDSARGMVAGTDPSLLLNSTAAEVNANSIYTTTGGFQIVSTAADINASGGTYLYLSIA